MKDSDFSNKEFYIGNVVEIDYTTWIIQFKVPGIIDDLEVYPSAAPLFNHVYQIGAGDEIFLIRPNTIQNDTWMYLPITIAKQVGLFFGNNIIDLTNSGLIQVNTQDLNINLSRSLCITIGKAKITIHNSGSIEIIGNITNSGKNEYSDLFNKLSSMTDIT